MRKTMIAMLMGLSLSAIGALAWLPFGEAVYGATQESTLKEEVSGAAGERETPTLGKAIGILLPGNADDARWARDLAELQDGFAAAGYMVRAMFAGGDSSAQSTQLKALAERKAAAIVIAPVGGGTPDEGLAQAQEAGIGIYSYDALLMDTPVIDYFLTFDYRSAGKEMGNALVKRFSLSERLKAAQSDAEETEEVNPLTVEFFFSEKNSAGLFFFNGMMESLQTYFENGILTCPSGRDTYPEAVSSEGEGAKDRWEELYGREGVANIVVTGDPSSALSLAAFLEEKGFSANKPGWPCITSWGVNAQVPRALLDRQITYTYLWDERDLAKNCVKTVTASLTGEDPPKSNFSQYDNGVRLVKSVLTKGTLLERSTVSYLVDEGFFSPEEIYPYRRSSLPPRRKVQ